MPTLNPNIKKDLSALRILLAEGDQINLAVIKHLLKKEGCYFDMAKNANEILIKLQNDEFDLMLIDLDHQQINAYNIILKIRQAAIKQESQLPVLGITNEKANLDLKKYADAGINNYIDRPTKLNALTQAIHTSITPTLNVPAEYTTEVASTINLKMLYATCGNSETVNNILKLFIAQTPDNMNQLEVFIKTENWDGMKNLCHNMKSVYSLIGLSDIKKQLDEIEKDCGNQTTDVGKFNSYFENIKVVNVKVIDEMKSIIEESITKAIR